VHAVVAELKFQSPEGGAETAQQELLQEAARLDPCFSPPKGAPRRRNTSNNRTKNKYKSFSPPKGAPRRRNSILKIPPAAVLKFQSPEGGAETAQPESC